MRANRGAESKRDEKGDERGGGGGGRARRSGGVYRGNGRTDGEETAATETPQRAINKFDTRVGKLAKLPASDVSI